MIGAITAGLYGTGVPPVTNSYESIATVTIGSGGAATASFSSIPSTYKHLQIRFLARTNRASLLDGIYIRVGNGSVDTGANYVQHSLLGDGASASAGAGTGQTYSVVTLTAGNTATSGVFGAGVIDILDYANTSKNKVTRTLGGYDRNGGGYAALYSGLWLNTAAINAITLGSSDGTGLIEFSQFALYGIKG